MSCISFRNMVDKGESRKNKKVFMFLESVWGSGVQQTGPLERDVESLQRPAGGFQWLLIGVSEFGKPTRGFKGMLFGSL